MNPRPVRTWFVFVWVTVTVVIVAAGLGAGQLLMALFPARLFASTRFSPWFAASSLVLGLGSLSLTRAVAAVQRERQAQFRNRLHTASLCGVLFVALQAAALQHLFQWQNPLEVQVSDRALVGVAASLHLLHFLMALFLLVYVTVQAHYGRYDHEYTWGVMACTWVWHGLLIVWLAILVLIALAGSSRTGPAARWDPVFQRPHQP